MSVDQILLWAANKYLIIGLIGAVAGLVFAIILDAAINLFEQWEEQDDD